MQGRLITNIPRALGFSEIPAGAWFIHQDDSTSTEVSPYLKLSSLSAMSSKTHEVYKYPGSFVDRPVYYIVKPITAPEWRLA